MPDFNDRRPGAKAYERLSAAELAVQRRRARAEDGRRVTQHEVSLDGQPLGTVKRVRDEETNRLVWRDDSGNQYGSREAAARILAAQADVERTGGEAFNPGHVAFIEEAWQKQKGHRP